MALLNLRPVWLKEAGQPDGTAYTTACRRHFRCQALAVDLFDDEQTRLAVDFFDARPRWPCIRALLCKCCLPCARGNWHSRPSGMQLRGPTRCGPGGAAQVLALFRPSPACRQRRQAGAFLKEISAIVRAICRDKDACLTRQAPEAGVRAAEATLLRSQHLGLGRGGPVPQFSHHFPLAVREVFKSGTNAWRGETRVSWFGLVASPKDSYTMGVLSEEPAARSRFLEGHVSSTSGVIFHTVHCDSYCAQYCEKKATSSRTPGGRIRYLGGRTVLMPWPKHI